MSFLVTMSTLAWGPHAAFGLCGRVPLASPLVSLQFRMLALLPWQALGRHPS
jgi:hypothetical protein